MNLRVTPSKSCACDQEISVRDCGTLESLVAAIGEAVGVQAIAITIRDEDFEEWILPADRSDVKEGMSIRVQAGAEAPSSKEEVVAAAQSLRGGGAAEREAVYVTIESAVKQQGETDIDI